MKVAILGKTGSGRSTVFDALTGLGGAPRTPGKTRLGIAVVPDPRVDALTLLCKPKKTVYVELALALPPNTSTRPVDIPVVREMRDLGIYTHVAPVYSETDPFSSARTQMVELTTELVLADMERVENRRARIAKGGGARPGEEAALERAAQHLDGEKPLRRLDWDESSRALLDELGLTSQKPLLTIVNVSEAMAGEKPDEGLVAAEAELGCKILWLSAALEAEIAALQPEARAEFLSAYGLSHPVSHRFVQAALSLLDQICFYTVGPDEVRAWAIPRGTNARRAARAIHTDLEKGFIRAEVIDYDVFVALGSEAKCRATGKMRVEGKDYIVKDGDIITVRFNV